MPTATPAKIAHELNNPLDAVLRFISLAQRKASAGDFADIERHLADAQFGLQRIAEILRDFMQAPQPSDLPAESLSLPDIIAVATRITAAQAEQKQITLTVRNSLPPDLAPRYDQRLIQVLVNLLKNALDASPPNASIRLTISRSPQSSVLITVLDSGPGIPADLLPHLFTSFITTKPNGAGHGLGLAISRELLIPLAGTLTLQNRPAPHAGCIAAITLP